MIVQTWPPARQLWSKKFFFEKKFFSRKVFFRTQEHEKHVFRKKKFFHLGTPIRPLMHISSSLLNSNLEQRQQSILSSLQSQSRADSNGANPIEKFAQIKKLRQPKHGHNGRQASSKNFQCARPNKKNFFRISLICYIVQIILQLTDDIPSCWSNTIIFVRNQQHLVTIATIDIESVPP